MTLYTYFSHFIPLRLLYLLRFPIFMRVLHFYIYTLVYVLKFALSFFPTEEIPLFTPPRNIILYLYLRLHLNIFYFPLNAHF